jgi:hypothetical protein
MMEEPRANLTSEVEILDRAVWRKWNKYTWSGLAIIGLGCLLIAAGLLLNSGAYSAEGLMIGFGAIIILIGLIRIGIGLINPLAPSDLRSRYRRRSSTHVEVREADQILHSLEDRDQTT